MSGAIPANAEPLVDINWFGATLADVRASRPDVAWVEEPNPYGFDELTHLTAASFANVGDRSFDINVTQAHGIVVSARLQSTTNVTNARECEVVSLDAATNLEPRLGAFYWDRTLSHGQISVPISDQSVVIVQGWRRSPRLEPVTRAQYTHPDTTGFAVRARARPTNGRITLNALLLSDLDGAACRVRIEIDLPFDQD